MLRQSFIHLPNVGHITERKIWDSGIQTWRDFLDAPALPSRINGDQERLRSLIEHSAERLEARDAAYFTNYKNKRKVLPPKERWRIYPDFRQRAAFLDIETTGLSPERSIITLIGVLDSHGYTAYVQDQNLHDFREALEQYDLIVTFNGASFDLPFIAHHFGDIFSNIAHLDLLFPLKSAGFSGGLKSIERQAAVGRPLELTDLDGYDAVRLWKLWRQGSEPALDTLIRYNAEDVASLPALAEIAYNLLAAKLPTVISRIAPTHRHNIDLPYSQDVIDRLKYKSL